MVFDWDLAGRIQASILFDFSIVFLLHIAYYKKLSLAQAVLYRKRSLETYEFEYRQKAITVSLSANSAYEENSVVCAKIKELNSKTLLHIKSYNLLP